MVRVGSSCKRRAARPPGLSGQAGVGGVNFRTRRTMPSSSLYRRDLAAQARNSDNGGRLRAAKLGRKSSGRTERHARRSYGMSASQTVSARCSRAQSVCEYHSTDSRNSSSAVEGVSGRAAGALTRRGASQGRVPSKGGAGVAASVVCWIGTVGTVSMEGPGAT